MNIKKAIFCIALGSVCVTGIQAQSVSGYVVSSDSRPIADAVITCPGCATVRTDKDGHFTIEGVKTGATIKIWHEGFFTLNKYIHDNNDKSLRLHLISENRSRYNETAVTPIGLKENDHSLSSLTNVNRKDYAPGSLTIENALKGEVAGLQVTNKSGMTGEGAYLQLRGVKTFIGENNPLVVINGVPYMPDLNESQIIGGYSRSIFQALNNQDVRNITVLKGSETSLYGSLGSNGVIMIETDQATSDNLDTRISFSAIYGFNWNKKRIPLMNSSMYKTYLEDIGLTYYANMEQFFNDFTFLSDPTANNAHLYQYNTNWQDEIFRNSNTMDYLFRVEGGDNIAKYNISLGYMGDDGTLRNTNSDRYSAQINANVLVSKKFEIYTNFNTAYMTGNYQEQGMTKETNPLLAAYRRSPLLSPYASDLYGNLIDKYSDYHYGAITNEKFIVSNPLAIVDKLSSKSTQYDINLKLGFNYRPITNLTVNGNFGLYYNYDREEEFIPGKDDNDISPLFDKYGEAKNSVRQGTNHTLNLFGGLNAAYKFNVGEQHAFAVNAGGQFLIDSYEYDAAFGRNSNNDFYQTLGDAQTLGKYFSGYNNKWNWLSFFAHADYTFANTVKLGVTASYDGASSIGEDATRMSFYPAADIVFMAKELIGGSDWLNKLNLYANYGLTGNSRFSSKLGRYYYTSQPYQTIAGIIRATVPNTELKAERDATFNVGLETSTLNNRLMFNVGYYNIKATNVIINGVHSSILGTSPYYSNEGEIASSGVEISLNAMPIDIKDFKWSIGGTLSTLNNEVKSLGSSSQFISTLSDNAEIVTRTGESPYSFYGYQTAGVFSTTAEAKSAHTNADGTTQALTNRTGLAYKAGDVHFIDQNGDGIINDEDKVVLGSATPDLFGSLFTRFEYKNVALDITFAYSLGNDIYNATRRITESGLDFSNQSTSLARRWSMEGQLTDIPRVSYGDAIGNNTFSDRWIEDGSYIKLRDITLSYTYDKPLWNFLQGFTVFATGQNLFCITDYLGLDPETSYGYSPLMQGVDYGKTPAPRSFKLGVNLKF